MPPTFTPAESRAVERTACPYVYRGRACAASPGQPCTNGHGEPMPYVHRARVQADRGAHPVGRPKRVGPPPVRRFLHVEIDPDLRSAYSDVCERAGRTMSEDVIAHVVATVSDGGKKKAP